VIVTTDSRAEATIEVRSAGSVTAVDPDVEVVVAAGVEVGVAAGMVSATSASVDVEARKPESRAAATIVGRRRGGGVVGEGAVGRAGEGSGSNMASGNAPGLRRS
jgi:hypothetical protein